MDFNDGFTIRLHSKSANVQQFEFLINLDESFLTLHSFFVTTYKGKLNIISTRMHSSRMRTVCCSGHLMGGGGCLLRGCLPGGGCLTAGWVSAWGVSA